MKKTVFVFMMLLTVVTCSFCKEDDDTVQGVKINRLSTGIYAFTHPDESVVKICKVDDDEMEFVQRKLARGESYKFNFDEMECGTQHRYPGLKKDLIKSMKDDLKDATPRERDRIMNNIRIIAGEDPTPQPGPRPTIPNYPDEEEVVVPLDIKSGKEHFYPGGYRKCDLIDLSHQKDVSLEDGKIVVKRDDEYKCEL